MKRLTLFLTFIIPSLTFAQGSEEIEGNSLKDRIYFGGNLGLQFGTITNIEVSPLVGYRLTNDFSVGVGITYIYFKTNYNNYPDFETNIYGYRLFGRYSITEQFYATAEYENLSLEFYNFNDGSIRREWVPGAFVGGGYFQPIGRNAGFNIAVLYNVLHDDLRSPYNSPWVFRIGITAGF
ncbi:hypothetical protein [Fulvivirga lutimaris]|uniref:hypothetical protein n=1 Tax=Fulvivirga lutimaris TaxID=1819566 RepID=UPI0012BBB88C|nr:hypothetical protein [Fulvivirga lutimaris]MTI41479.1 hypothetical protein [Fulvivirga lutimaris]